MLPLLYRYLHVAHRRATLLGKLWPLPRIRREASTWTPSTFDPPRQIRASYLQLKQNLGPSVVSLNSIRFCQNNEMEEDQYLWV